VGTSDAGTWSRVTRISLTAFQESFMLRRFRRNIPAARALRLEPPTIAQGGLAFLIAYAVAYVVQGF
jgi:hypothetical protein